MIVAQCHICRQFVHVPCTNEQFLRWKRHEACIQVIMPDVPRELREVLISGYCPECWDKLFGKPEN